MARVSKETIKKLNEFFDTLPTDARNKCALCNETLTHIVKLAEAQTGAPTATVTRELASRVNDGAAPGDVVSGERLRDRVRVNSGEKVSGTESQINNPAPEPATEIDDFEDPPEPELFVATTQQEILDAAKIIKKETAANHRAMGTGENEWYTPGEYISKAIAVMGSIDLDPATSELSNSKIKAEKIFTVIDNGLKHEWVGNVWLNPPYSQPAINDFANKIVEEWQSGRVNSAIVLTHNYTDTKWFHTLACDCNAICFTRGRIAFVNMAGEKAAPTQGQAFFYFGDNIEKFVEEFKDVGFIVKVL